MPSRLLARAAFGAALLSLACGGEEPAPSGSPLAREAAAPLEERPENSVPVVEQLVLHPPAPLPGQRIEARIDAYDPDGDPIRLELEWRHAGRVIATGSRTSLAPEGLVKGDEVEVRASASDGRDTSEPLRAAVTVGNRDPLIRALHLTPKGEIAPGQPVTAVPQAVDPDGDALQYEYEWLVNGEPVRGASEPSFATEDLKRGDRLQAHVRVSDGEAWSPTAESVTLDLANRPPRFAELPAVDPSSGSFRIDLAAEDPDGDHSLRFRLQKGPDGMTVDPVSGRVSWRPGRDAAGNHAVEVAVADSFGAESALRFELTVSGAGPDPKAPPAKRGGDEAEDEEAAEAEE